MKPKLLYIIAALAVILLLISIEIRHQADLQLICALAAENEALIQQYENLDAEYGILEHSTAFMWDIFAKQMDDIDRLRDEIEKIQQTNPPSQKTSRGEVVRYSLIPQERDLIERVVMAESGGESYEGQMLVCQCILNACEIDDIRPAEAIKKYAYAKSRPEPSESIKRAVSAVFDKGERVTDEAIVYFYAPKLVKSKFHESQKFVLTEGNHKFFAER